MRRGRIVLLGSGILFMLILGCALYGETVAPDDITIRVENRSNIPLFEVASNCFVDGESVGTMAVQAEKKNVYNFRIPREKLFGRKTEIKSLRLAFYAGRNPGEDFNDCGSIEIRRPKLGKTYSLAIGGKSVSGLFMLPVKEDSNVKVFIPGFLK